MLPRIETNSVQQFSALNAFKSNQNVSKSDTEQAEVSKGINTTSAKTLLDRIDVNEVREYYKEYATTPAMRVLITTLKKKGYSDLASSVALARLFPDGAAKTASVLFFCPYTVDM